MSHFSFKVDTASGTHCTREVTQVMKIINRYGAMKREDFMLVLGLLGVIDKQHLTDYLSKTGCIVRQLIPAGPDGVEWVGTTKMMIDRESQFNF